MKIVITEKELDAFAMESLKRKYSALIPEETELSIEKKYTGEIEITLRPKEDDSSLTTKGIYLLKERGR